MVSILVSIRIILGLPRFGVTYYVATQKFMTPISKDVLFDGILKGMIASLGEPHSVYLDQKI